MGIRDMFTTYKTEPPQLGLWYFVLLGLVFAIIWLPIATTIGKLTSGYLSGCKLAS